LESYLIRCVGIIFLVELNSLNNYVESFGMIWSLIRHKIYDINSLAYFYWNIVYKRIHCISDLASLRRFSRPQGLSVFLKVYASGYRPYIRCFLWQVMSTRHQMATGPRFCLPPPIPFPPSPPDSLPSPPNQSTGPFSYQPGGSPSYRQYYGSKSTRRTSTTRPGGVSGAQSVSVDVPLTPVTGRPRATHPGCTTIKYNRRANPELDKRRTHFCNYPGIHTCRRLLQVRHGGNHC